MVCFFALYLKQFFCPSGHCHRHAAGRQHYGYRKPVGFWYASTRCRVNPKAGWQIGRSDETYPLTLTASEKNVETSDHLIVIRIIPRPAARPLDPPTRTYTRYSPSKTRARAQGPYCFSRVRVRVRVGLLAPGGYPGQESPPRILGFLRLITRSLPELSGSALS